MTNGIVGLSSNAGASQASAVASNTAFQSGFSAGDTLNQLQAAVPAGVTFSTPTLYVNPSNYHTIKTLEWSLELEQPLTRHDVVTFSYAGNHGYDEPLANTAANGWAANGSGGLQGQASYTWSKALQLGPGAGTTGASGAIYNPTLYALNGSSSVGKITDNYGPTA